MRHDPSKVEFSVHIRASELGECQSRRAASAIRRVCMHVVGVLDVPGEPLTPSLQGTLALLEPADSTRRKHRGVVYPQIMQAYHMHHLTYSQAEGVRSSNV